MGIPEKLPRPQVQMRKFGIQRVTSRAAVSLSSAAFCWAGSLRQTIDGNRFLMQLQEPMMLENA